MTKVFLLTKNKMDEVDKKNRLKEFLSNKCFVNVIHVTLYSSFSKTVSVYLPVKLLVTKHKKSISVFKYNIQNYLAISLFSIT